MNNSHWGYCIRACRERLDWLIFYFYYATKRRIFNSNYKFTILESDSYRTLRGFIVDFTKEIPQKGSVIAIGSYHFIIEEATNKKIELVKMILQEWFFLGK